MEILPYPLKVFIIVQDVFDTPPLLERFRFFDKSCVYPYIPMPVAVE